jgi:hypothetical protein
MYCTYASLQCYGIEHLCGKKIEECEKKIKQPILEKDMVPCLVIGVGIGGGTAMGAETDGSVINLIAMTFFELQRLRRKY